ncbi:MAG: radical SAM/SPASM domain-containing protein [Pseudonocardiaceae bacterium]
MTASADGCLHELCRTMRRVVIENFNYCNRVCSFCSNTVIDRRSSKVYLPDRLYTKILDELAEGGYSHALAYGRYSEPLADPITVERVAQARSALPTAHLFVNTNGDYLDRALLEQLFCAGLDELKVMRYLPAGRPFTTDEGARSCEALLTALGLPGRLVTYEPEVIVYYEADLPWPGALSVRAESYTLRGCDRGGTLAHLAGERRLLPCHAPTYELNIDFDGSVVPCCNMRSDAPLHQPYVLGNVTDTSLADIYFGARARSIRGVVARPSPNLPPCLTCTYVWPTERAGPDPVRPGR